MSNIDQEVKTGLNQMVFFPHITKLTETYLAYYIFFSQLFGYIHWHKSVSESAWFGILATVVSSIVIVEDLLAVRLSRKWAALFL